MSIATAITDFKNRISAIYDILELNNAEMPEKKDTRNLPSTIETVLTSLDSNKKYTMIKYSNDVKSFYLIEGELDIDTIPNLSDVVEISIGTDVTDIASGMFSDCTSLTSVTIHNKTWQDAIDNNYWGISDPNIMHGDWDKYLSLANASKTVAAIVTMVKTEVTNFPLDEINLLSSITGADGSWQSYDLTSIITLNSYGDRVFFKADSQNTAFANGDTSDNIKSFWRFNLDGEKVIANGNIMSLLDGENELSSVNSDYCFAKLLRDNATLILAPLLPAKTLIGNRCYGEMFAGCTNLSVMPELPATIISKNCYRSMFNNCTSLVTISELPATILAYRCYFYMFSNCTSIETVLKINATTLTTDCFGYMFNGCTSLKKIMINFLEWKPSNITNNWLLNAGKNVSETTFICPNLLDVSTRSNNTIPEDTETHTWNIRPTLDQMMTMLEDYPKFKDLLPAVSSDIFVDYMLNDKASDNTVCNTRALVEEKQDMLSTINTPWTILGYNKTIPQYVKYRRKKFNGTYDYLYVSSVDDTTVKATIDGVELTIAIKHEFENALLINENDLTGLLRPITAGCKTYTRNNTNLPFGETSLFTVTNKLILSVSEYIALNIEAKDGLMHTYGNNNPYDCPASIVVDGKRYKFCGYTVTIQSKHLLTGNNGSYLESARFDAPELSAAEAFNRYEDNKEYYKRNGTTFTKMTVTTGNPIFEEEVYEKDNNTMICKSSYILDYHTYNIDSTVGTLITDSNAILLNNDNCANGSNKWSLSDIRVFMNSTLGAKEFKTIQAAKKKNKFEQNTALTPLTIGISNGNGLLLKFAKANEFMKFIGPSINRTSIFDMQYNTANYWNGSFIAYKNLEDSSCNTLDKKIYRTHDIDNLFLIAYTECGFTSENLNFDKNDATSNFNDVYSSEDTRIKYRYESNGSLSQTSYYWWLKSSSGYSSQTVCQVNNIGKYNSNSANTNLRLAPACTLY